MSPQAYPPPEQPRALVIGQPLLRAPRNEKEAHTFGTPMHVASLMLDWITEQKETGPIFVAFHEWLIHNASVENVDFYTKENTPKDIYHFFKCHLLPFFEATADMADDYAAFFRAVGMN